MTRPGRRSLSAFWTPRYWPAWAGLGLLRLSCFLPYRRQLAIGKFLGRVVHRLAPRRRAITHRNIELCFPELATDEVAAMTLAHFEALGASLIELALGRWASDEKLLAMTTIEGAHHIREAIDGGYGWDVLDGGSRSAPGLAFGGGLLGQLDVHRHEVGAELADHTGLGEAFVGSLFIGVSTSLPEIVVSFAAVRIGAADLAYGNLLGSNLFNLAILGIDDILYPGGPILDVASPAHGIAALIAIAMTSVVIVALVVRSGRRYATMPWESIVILMLYGLSIALLFAMSIPAGQLAL